MVNALSQVRKGYARAIEHIKELVDKGRDPDDARAGTTQERLSSTSGPTLADLVHAATQRDNQDVDMSELSEDLSCLLVDKAQIGSDILQRITNLQPQGGIRMYAEYTQRSLAAD